MGFYERLLLFIREKKASYHSMVMSGNLPFDEYKSITGIVKGLSEAEECAKRAYVKSYEDSEE